MSSRPRPSRPIRIAVGVLLLATGSAGCQLEFSNDAEARDQWTRRYTLASGGQFELRETNGSIRVEGVAGDAVDIVADRVVKAPTDEAAKTALAEFVIAEEVSPDRIVIDGTVKAPQPFSRINRRAEYVVKLPRSARVTLRTANGSVEVSNVDGRLRVVSTNGRIVGRGLGDGAEVSTTNGVVTLDLAGLGDGVTVEAANGRIDVAMPADSDADLSLRTTNGRIVTEGMSVTVLEQSRRRLDGTLGEGGADVRLETTNGEVRVRAR